MPQASYKRFLFLIHCQMKNWFMLYWTQYAPIKMLTLYQKWQLLDMIFGYNIDPKNIPKCDDEIVKITFGFFLQQFKIDENKYENICARNKENWKKWGRPPNEKPKKPNGIFGNPKNPEKPKKPDNDNDNDKDKDKDNENKKEKKEKVEFEIFWEIYWKKINRDFCEKKRNSLKDFEREKIMETLPSRLKQFTDIQFQPYPWTYLNQKRWNDVIKNKPQNWIILW